ncbi:MAG: (2Fe-2S) ferredoxin protein [Burkholderiaceae bacterium]|nr:(2Fe-2S) ferredoxin protein [Burkholderiaceae bacterium]
MGKKMATGHHLFFCANERDSGKCCLNKHSKKVQKHAKKRVKELGLKGDEKIRINQTDCLGLCGSGPVVVVYPEGVWYSYQDNDDIDRIVEQHLLGGKVVKKLVI